MTGQLPQSPDTSSEHRLAGAGSPAEPAEGGDTTCWAHLVCPECGAMVSEGHLPGCGSGQPAP